MPNVNLFKSIKLAATTTWNTFRQAFLVNSYVTFILAILVVVCFFIPNSQQQLAFHAPLIIDEYQWWRIFTAPFAHRNIDHLTWNLITLISSSLVCEQVNRKVFVVYLVLALITTSAFKFISGIGAINSLGFSNIAAGTFALLLLLIAGQGYKVRDIWVTIVPLIMWVTYCLYELTLLSEVTGWELISGRSINETPNMQLKLGHIVGILTGTAVGIATWLIHSIKQQH